MKIQATPVSTNYLHNLQKKTNSDRVSFNWPLIKFSAWLSSLGQLFIAEHHALRESTSHKSLYGDRDTAYRQLMETPADELTYDDNNMPSDNLNHVQLSIDPDIGSKSSHTNATPDMLSTELSSSSETVNPNGPLTGFNNWLSSLFHKFVGKTDTRVPLRGNDYCRQLDNADIFADILSEQHVNASFSEHVEIMENIGGTALSSGRRRSLVAATKQGRSLSFAANDHFAFADEQVQEAVWPALPDEENSDGHARRIGGAVLSEKAPTKTAIEDIVWPELMPNSSIDRPGAVTEVEKFNALSTANNTGITKILDTMKERKQRELKGTLWNA